MYRLIKVQMIVAMRKYSTNRRGQIFRQTSMALGLRLASWHDIVNLVVVVRSWEPVANLLNLIQLDIDT